MKITKRDLAIVEFLDKVGVADTTTINKMFFNNSVKACKNRMKLIFDVGMVKRLDRKYLNQEYIYYTKKKPVQIEHKLLLSRFIAELKSQGADIISIIVPFSVGNVIADALLTYAINKTVKTDFVEVENQKTFKSTSDKYVKLYKNGDYKKSNLPFMPNIIIISDEHEFKIDNIKTKFIRKDFSNLKEKLF